MRLFTLFVIVGLILNIFIAGAFIATGEIRSNIEMGKKAKVYLSDMTGYYQIQMNNYFRERLKDMYAGALSNKMKFLFNSTNWDSLESSKMNIKKNTNIVAQGIDNYILNHPKKTIKDLQNDEKFLSLLNSSFDERVNFIVFDSNSLISYYNSKDSVGGYNYSKNNFSGSWDFINKIKISNTFEGIYSIHDSEGNIKYEYGYLVRLNSSTFEGEELNMISITSLDKYPEIDFERRVNYVKELFMKYGYYDNFILLDNSGKTLFASSKKDYDDSVMDKLYHKIIENTSIEYIEVNNDENNESILFLLAPYFEESKVSGFFVFEMSKDYLLKLFEKMDSETVPIKKYLVDNEGNILIGTNFTYDKQPSFIYDNLNNCIANRENYYKNKTGEEVVSVLEYENKKNAYGKKILSTNRYLLNPSECILTEINYKDLGIFHLKFKNYSLIFIISLAMWIVGFIFISIINRIYTFKKRGLKK